MAYSFTVRLENGARQPQTYRTDGVAIDRTVPTRGLVWDGKREWDDAQWQQIDTELSVTWISFLDLEAPITRSVLSAAHGVCAAPPPPHPRIPWHVLEVNPLHDVRSTVPVTAFRSR